MARPSSSTSDLPNVRPGDGVRAAAASADGGGGRGRLFGFQERGGAPRAVADSAWLAAMLDFEAALARAEARAGLMPAADAELIAAACRPELYDGAAIGEAAAGDGVPAIALVRALTERVGEAADEAAAAAGGGATGAAAGGGPTGAGAAGQVHRGATSQDVMDTAAMLVARRALRAVIADLAAAAAAAAALADVHRSAAMPGRTWLQQGSPTTFGLVASTWLAGLDRAGERLAQAAAQLPVQLGGAVGTLASLGPAGVPVISFLASELGLAEPAVPWHADRTPIAALAGALGEVAAAAAKPAYDIVLLSSTEIAEVAERGAGGGSSTMPQKHNPVAAVCARATAARVPGLVSTLLAASPGELQRAAGGWQAEWWALSELLVATGSAVAWLRDSLERLDVHPDRMRANLDLTGGLVMAERVTTALQPSLGRMAAHRLVEEAARSARDGRSFADALLDSPEIAAVLDRTRLNELLRPDGYLGSAGSFVDRAIEAHRSARWVEEAR